MMSFVPPGSAYKKTVWQSALAVLFYMTVSITLVFLNRLVLTDKEGTAGALFVSWYQFLVAYGLIIIITTFFPTVPLVNVFPSITCQMGVLIRAIPVSIVYLFMIGCSNKCLEYVSVSGYQILRSLSIVFNVFFTFLFFGETTSIRAVIACIGVVFGLFCGIEGESDLSARGATYGIVSSLFVALYAIMVKESISLLDGNEYLLIEYSTLIAIIALAPMVLLSGEFVVLAEGRPVIFWLRQTIAGLVGFLVNIAIILNIKYTTPLTHNLSGMVKACIQTLLAFVVFPQSVVMTPMKWAGAVLVIGFSAYYAYVRTSEMKRKIAEDQPPMPLVNFPATSDAKHENEG
jgi:GDP-fucose transporter C1